MAYSRYTTTPIFLNKDQGYKDAFFKQRDIKETFQLDLPRLSFPNPAQINNLTTFTEVWKSTDKLYNISQKHYGDPSYWWVIAWYNEKSSEAEFKMGDIYYIPLPLSDVLGYFN